MTAESKQAERPWFVGLESECDGEQLGDGQIVGGYTGRDVYDGRIYTVGPVRTGPGDQDFEDDAIEIARVHDQTDAERIVRAVNAHEDLISECRKFEQFLEAQLVGLRCDAGNHDGGSAANCEHCQILKLLETVRAALAKAENGGTPQ